MKCISCLCAADVSIAALMICFCRVELAGYAGLRPGLSEQNRPAPPWLRSRDRPGHSHGPVKSLLLAVWTCFTCDPRERAARVNRVMLRSGMAICGRAASQPLLRFTLIRLMLAPYLVAASVGRASVWEHSVLLSQSHSDVWLFLARLLSGAFAWVGLPVFLPVFYLFAFTFIRLLFSQSKMRFFSRQGGRRSRPEVQTSVIFT